MKIGPIVDYAEDFVYNYSMKENGFRQGHLGNGEAKHSFNAGRPNLQSGREVPTQGIRAIDSGRRSGQFDGTGSEQELDPAKRRITKWYERIMQPGLSDLDRLDVSIVAEGHITDSVFKKKPSDNFEFFYKMIDPDNLAFLLETVGLDPKKTRKAWDSGFSGKTWGSVDGVKGLYSLYKDNFTTILELEVASPGSVRVLAEEFGILNFARYRSTTNGIGNLVDQYEHRDDRSLPYGMVVVDRDDHNKAFLGLDKAVDDLVDKNYLNKEYLLRIYEIDEGDSLVETFRSAKRRYGPNREDGHKISFGYWAGHGTIKSVGKYLSTNDPLFWDTALQAEVRNMFVEHPTIIFASCLTGRIGGIAHQTSEILQATTFGPDNISGTPDIQTFHTGGDVFTFNVRYPQADNTPVAPITNMFTPTH